MNITPEISFFTIIIDLRDFGQLVKGLEVKWFESKIKEIEYVRIISNQCGDMRMAT